MTAATHSISRRLGARLPSNLPPLHAQKGLEREDKQTGVSMFISPYDFCGALQESQFKMSVWSQLVHNGLGLTFPRHTGKIREQTCTPDTRGGTTLFFSCLTTPGQKSDNVATSNTQSVARWGGHGRNMRILKFMGWQLVCSEISFRLLMQDYRSSK